MTDNQEPEKKPIIDFPEAINYSWLDEVIKQLVANFSLEDILDSMSDLCFEKVDIIKQKIISESKPRLPEAILVTNKEIAFWSYAQTKLEDLSFELRDDDKTDEDTDSAEYTLKRAEEIIELIEKMPESAKERLLNKASELKNESEQETSL